MNLRRSHAPAQMMRYDAQTPAVRAALADAKFCLRIRMNERLTVQEVKRREELLLKPSRKQE